MAFNLMARDDLDVVYIVYEKDSPMEFKQLVYSAFIARSATYGICVEKDLKLVRSAGISDISMKSSLHSYGFLYSVLTGSKTMRGPRTRREVYDALAARQNQTKTLVFFLDEMPFVEDPETSDLTPYVVFMCNVLRSFNFVVIQSSVTGVLRNIVTNEVISRDCEDSYWCIVYPLLDTF
ncbi:hypothetical protein GN958_ATG18730 [Phytophthora infestans]|uniref:Crinkler (CRN) family protein n=1 Tax=Phytophthora infestans TaxID=4787 RepID=A0A8S9TU83_PHYIN|nr:hypothetical protein GN958_ATG18730 [Phytophthora infestans]